MRQIEDAIPGTPARRDRRSRRINQRVVAAEENRTNKSERLAGLWFKMGDSSKEPAVWEDNNNNIHDGGGRRSLATNGASAAPANQSSPATFNRNSPRSVINIYYCCSGQTCHS